MVSRNVRLSTYSPVLLGMASSLNWASWQNSISISVLFLANLGKMSFITYNKSTIDLVSKLHMKSCMQILCTNKPILFYFVCDCDSYIVDRNGNNSMISVILKLYFSQTLLRSWALTQENINYEVSQMTTIIE